MRRSRQACTSKAAAHATAKPVANPSRSIVPASTKKKRAKVKEAKTTLCNRRAAAPPPCARWVNTARIVEYTGNGAISPLHLGPSQDAAPVSPKTKAVAAGMRRIISQRGEEALTVSTSLLGNSASARTIERRAARKVSSKGQEYQLTIPVTARYAPQLAIVLVSHPLLEHNRP